MTEYTTFSIETRAEKVSIRDGKHNGKIHVMLEGISIGDIKGILDALANSGGRNESEFERCIMLYIKTLNYAERGWKRLWSQTKFEQAKSEICELSDLELIQLVNDHMANEKNLNLPLLTACRMDMNRRLIDYSAINSWNSISDWKKVSLYSINGRKFIKPVDHHPDITQN
jgi:hypothetical protein